ncbi:MAG TPA: COX15/CtaA family protein [Microbacteriaceae bacterium]|nr:COX15/CtaA family protein [Microbacteriaceae bacterium]
MGSAAPVVLPRRFTIAAWISFLANILIVGTGGAVRLTGSGLGCPTWPTCVGSSVVSTPEMGIHGIIEFGNRTLTGVLLIAALVVLVFTWRVRKQRRDLWALARIVLLGIIAQAIVGGITVLVKLNPTIVGFHYIVSLILVCITAAYLVRLRAAPGKRELVVPARYAILAHLTSAAIAITVTFGVLTTGAGPHSGDPNAGRNGFNAEFLQHVHSWPAYASLAGAVALVLWSLRGAPAVRNWSLAVLGVIGVQIVVGLWQARTGLPILLVGIHMVLAVVLAAVMTVLIMKLKQPATAD